MKKKFVIIAAIVLVVIVFLFVWNHMAGETGNDKGTIDEKKESAKSENLLDAKVLEIHEEYLMVEALDGQSIAGEVQIWIGLLSDKEIPDMKVGDVIRIPHDGKMTMSLPPQMSAVGAIEVINDD